jgi:hypothetical protein
MKKYTETEDFGPSEYDFGFDFDFRFTAFDYLLMGLYALFVFPFALLAMLASGSLQKYNDWQKNHDKGMTFTSSCDSELTMVLCCPWPRTSQN